MKKHHYGIIALIMVFWFVISFITNIMGPLIPDIIANFKLEHLAMAGFIPVSFFLAYGVMSIPAGILIEKFSEKAVLLAGFAMPFVGSLIFALMPSYPVLLCSCFIIGLGMAMLQTVINPLKRVAGGEENFAFFSVMGQLVFGGAGFVSPMIYSYLVRELSAPGEPANALVGLLARVTPDNLPWVSLYWVFTGILLCMLVIISFVHFPKINLAADERAGSRSSYVELFRKRVVYIFFFGMIAYVATEQGVANWASEFLHTYHGIDPQTTGAAVVGRFWGLMSVGCLIGLAVLRLWDSRTVLKVVCVVAMALLLGAIYGGTGMALFCFPAVGFTISVMFSIIISMGLNSVDSHHGSMAGILCTGIVGGAVGPLVVGWIGDLAGLRTGMLFLVLTLCYILWIAFIAKPLINNKTVKLKDLFKKA